MILLATSCFAAAHHSHLVQIPNRGHTWLPSLSFQGQDSLGFQLLFILRARATHRVTVHSPPPQGASGQWTTYNAHVWGGLVSTGEAGGWGCLGRL